MISVFAKHLNHSRQPVTEPFGSVVMAGNAFEGFRDASSAASRPARRRDPRRRLLPSADPPSSTSFRAEYSYFLQPALLSMFTSVLAASHDGLIHIATVLHQQKFLPAVAHKLLLYHNILFQHQQLFLVF